MTNVVPVTHALFDMDGLLLDTEIIYTRVTQKIVSRFGKTFDWSLKSNMLGRKAIDSARYLVAELNLPITAEEYIEERNGMLRIEFGNTDALPGAERLIRHLHHHNIPIAVATSSNRDLYEIKSSGHQSWFSLFNTVVAGDDPEVKEGKPAPDIFNAAAQRIGATPSATLVFEDAPSGLAAGVAAKMRVVAVPDSNMDKTRYAQADLVLDSLVDFDPSRYGLPEMTK
ncbi:MAG: HAD-IA family hydrolase [Gammaproteobacteria bacterium]|nr:HAD-IA family hydrolase [Gammaproteobacteria bacterium]